MTDKISDEELKQKLTSEQYHVLRQGGTEPAFSGEYVHNKERGIYKCAACGKELFSSDTKFDSGTGWPSFMEPVNLKHIELLPDDSYGKHRTEVRCKNCGSHLGHVFEGHSSDKEEKQYCINSVCLDFQKE